MNRREMNPAAGDTARGARDALLDCKRPDHTTGGKGGKPSVTFDDSEGARVTVRGRQAQTLALLIEKGARGFTAGEASPLGWARRTSHYVGRLRKLGVQIETRREVAADGARVGRYVLMHSIRIFREGA